VLSPAGYRDTDQQGGMGTGGMGMGN
jgi:hypothetical protein